MAAYRYGGVKRAKADGCCEPVCGPTTCGSSAEKQQKAKVKPVAAIKGTA